MMSEFLKNPVALHKDKNGDAYMTADEWKSISTTKNDAVVKDAQKDKKVTQEKIKTVAASKPTKNGNSNTGTVDKTTPTAPIKVNRWMVDESESSGSSGSYTPVIAPGTNTSVPPVPGDYDGNGIPDQCETRSPDATGNDEYTPNLVKIDYGFDDIGYEDQNQDYWSALLDRVVRTLGIPGINSYLASKGTSASGRELAPEEIEWYLEKDDEFLMDAILFLALGGGKGLKDGKVEIPSATGTLKTINDTLPSGVTREVLANVAGIPGKGGVTPIGRAFQKHAGNAQRAGTFTGEVTGNVAKNTEQGMNYLNQILDNPNSTAVVRNTKAYGDVLDIRMPDGTGVRYSADGKTFIGFLEKYTPTK